MGLIDNWKDRGIFLAAHGGGSGNDLDIFNKVEELESLRGKRMRNRVAFMPGSTHGINQATAMLYALQDATVIFNGHTNESEAKFTQIQNLLEKAGVQKSKLAFIRFDIASPFDRRSSLMQIKDNFGMVDLLQLGPAIGAGLTDFTTVKAFNVDANLELLNELISFGLFRHGSDLIYDASNASHDWNGEHVMDNTTGNGKLYNRIYDLVAMTKYMAENELIARQEKLWRDHGIRLVVIVAPLTTHTKPVEVLQTKDQLHKEVVRQFGEIDRLTVAQITLDAVTQPYTSGPLLRIVDPHHTKRRNWLK